MKLDDMWKELREGNIFGWIKMLHDKIEQFVIPSLQTIAAASVGNIQALTPSTASAGEGSTNFYGDISVSADNPEQFVREIKRRRINRGQR
jgi:hypothetical protein